MVVPEKIIHQGQELKAALFDNMIIIGTKNTMMMMMMMMMMMILLLLLLLLSSLLLYYFTISGKVKLGRKK